MGELGATYTVYLILIGNLVVDFLFVLIIELFSLCVTGKALRAKTIYFMEIGVFKGVGQFRPNFHVVGDISREPFLHG